MFQKKVLAVIFTTIIINFVFTDGKAQQQWSLKQCIDYALENNISIKEAGLQSRLAALDYHLSRLSVFPSVSAGTNLGYSSGRNQDPTSFNLITAGYLSNGYQLQAGVDIFNWFSKKNTIAARENNLLMQGELLEKARNDIALNIATAYLQVILAQKQMEITDVKIEQTRQQLQLVKLQVAAEKIPLLQQQQVEAQLAMDESAKTDAAVAISRQLLLLKALLNMDAAVNFDVIVPGAIDKIPLESIARLQPEYVYNSALQNLPQQKADSFNIVAAKYTKAAARGQMFPTVSLFTSFGTTYNNRAQTITGKNTVNSPIGSVNINAVNYQVYPLNPFEIYSYGKIQYFNQLNQNFRQSIGISVNIPIFSNGTLKGNYKRAIINEEQALLRKQQNSFTLKQDIYQAYNDASAALQKVNAQQKAVETNEIAYKLANQRFQVGLLSSFELLNTQNQLATAKLQLLYARFDYIFKIKLLEFYKGEGLKL